MAENKAIEQVFEKLAEILTVNQLEKIAQLFLAKSSELISTTSETNETPTILGNLVNLTRSNRGTSHANWILDSGASRHVTGTSSEFASYMPFPPTRKETIQTADGTAQPIQDNEMQGGSTYVHCKAGRGRSTTVVLCFLIKYRNMTPEAALDHARSVRPRVLLAPSQWQAVKLFSTITTRCLSIQSSNRTHSVQSEEDFQQSTTVTTRCLSLSLHRSSEYSSVTSDEESSEPSIEDSEGDGYASEFDTEHFVLPRCRSMLWKPTSPTGCCDAVFITEADLEGYETYADTGNDVVSVDIVVRHKPIIRKLSCFLGSLKLTGNCEPPPSRLTEVRAC